MFSQKLVSLPALFALVGALAGVASASLQDKREDSPYFWNDTTGPVVWDVKLDSLTSGGSWLMAPVAALVLSNPDYLKRRMTWSADNDDVKVKLFQVSNTDTTEYTVKKGAMQDVEWSFWGKSQWPMAVASAVQAMANEHKTDTAYPISPDLNTGTIDIGYHLLFGSSMTDKVADLSDDDLSNKFGGIGSNSALVSGAADQYSQDGLNSGQYWTIISRDTAAKTVKLRNPWGIIGRKSVTELIDSKFEGMNKGDGVLEMDYAYFRRNFDSITGLGPAKGTVVGVTSVPASATGQQARRALPTA